MTPAEKMAARAAGTTEVIVTPAKLPEIPAFDPNDPEARIRAKQARHAVEGRTEKQRQAEAKAKEDAEASAKKADHKAEAKGGHSQK